MIYYVQYVSGQGPIKIGFTSRIQERMLQLRGDQPFDVKLLGYHEGSKDTEAKLHIKFKDIKWPAKNEYFKPDISLLNHIKRISIKNSGDAPFSSNENCDVSNKTIIQKYKTIFLTDKQVAEQTSLSVQTLRNWRSQGVGPKFHKPAPRVVRYRLDEVCQWMEEGLH